MKRARNGVFVIALLVSGCIGGVAGTGNAGGGGAAATVLNTQCRGDFGAGAAAQKLEAFMATTYAYSQAANDVQRTLLDSCRSMGRELGMDQAELAGTGPEATRRVCHVVSERLQSEMEAIRATAAIAVDVQTQPPRCEVSVDAYARCAATCEVEVEPGSVDIQCQGGELRGRCSAECSGRCALDVNARCEGFCEGMCQGTCAARAEDGSCAGACDGTCRGRCVTEVTGGCSGECRGGCSVEWQEPYCTGSITPPNVSADCRAACDARMDAEVNCQPGQVEVTIDGELEADMAERAARVRAAIRTGAGTILTLRARLQRLRRSGEQVLRLARDLPGAVGNIGVGAAACAAASIEVLRASTMSVSVSVEVSVEVSGSLQVQ